MSEESEKHMNQSSDFLAVLMPQLKSLNDGQDRIVSEMSTLKQDVDTKINQKIDKLISSVRAFITWTITIFLFLFSLNFAYTERVESKIKDEIEKLQEKDKELDGLKSDVGDIDGALMIRFPDSAVFGKAYQKYIIYRGSTK